MCIVCERFHFFCVWGEHVNVLKWGEALCFFINTSKSYSHLLIHYIVTLGSVTHSLTHKYYLIFILYVNIHSFIYKITSVCIHVLPNTSKFVKTFLLSIGAPLITLSALTYNTHAKIYQKNKPVLSQHQNISS